MLSTVLSLCPWVASLTPGSYSVSRLPMDASLSTTFPSSERKVPAQS